MDIVSDRSGDDDILGTRNLIRRDNMITGLSGGMTE